MGTVPVEHHMYCGTCPAKFTYLVLGHCLSDQQLGSQVLVASHCGKARSASDSAFAHCDLDWAGGTDAMWYKYDGLQSPYVITPNQLSTASRWRLK